MRTRADHVDELYQQYLVLAEYREWTSRATPSLTGYSSSCCRAEVRLLRKGDGYACIKCNRVCDTSSWHSPLSGAIGRGGWNGMSQLVYVNETRTRRIGAHEERIARGAHQIRALRDLFDPVPDGVTGSHWNRSKLAWQAWLMTRDYGEVAVAARLSRRAEFWTAENVRAWVECARSTVVQRADARTIGATKRAFAYGKAA